MSVPDREQLIRQIAANARENCTWRRRDSAEDWTADVLAALDRLGYSVTPAESPAEAAVRPQERPEGSEATPTDEMAVLDAVSGWRAAIESRNQGAVDDALVHLARVSAAWRAEGCSGRRQSVDDMLAEAAGRGWTLLNCISDRRGYRLCLEATGVVGPDVDGAGPTLYAAVEAAVRAVAVETEETPT